jgi:LysM repeat protein
VVHRWAPAARQGTSYTVVAGDTLTTIAQQRNIEGGWQALYDNNRGILSDPNVLHIGQQLTLG